MELESLESERLWQESGRGYGKREGEPRGYAKWRGEAMERENLSLER